MSGLSLGRLAPVVTLGLLAIAAILVQLSPTPKTVDEAAQPAATETAVMEATAVSQPATIVGSQSTANSVVARRGTLSEMLTLNGRIGGLEETTLSFRGPQRIAEVLVNPGDLVAPGQLLVRADERELARSLDGARERAAMAETKLAQAQAVASNQQERTDRRQELTRMRGDRAVSAAEAALRRAEEDAERIRAGASPTERRAAETAVASARAGVARAQSDLVRARQGVDPLEIRQAEQQIVLAKQSLDKALDEVRRLEQGADPMVVRAAERDFLTAQNGMVRAELDLQKLVQPDPAALAAAEREVQRAETALKVAQMNPGSSSSSSSSGKKDKDAERLAQAERSAAVQNAKMTLQAAQERLQTLRAGPPAGEVAVARRNLAAARSALDAARERLEVTRRGPDQTTIAQARTAVDTARLTHESAVARLATLQAGPDPEQVSAAAAALQSAQAALRTAEAQQADVLARPTRADLTAADEALQAAQEALVQARAEAELGGDTDQPTTDTPVADIALLQQALSQEQSAVRALEADLLDARLVSPSAAVVIAVMARDGSGADAGQPVIVLARQDVAPIVLADMPTTQGTRLAVGQHARVSYTGLIGDPLDTTIERLTDLGDGMLRLSIRPAWPPESPTLGAPATIQLVLQERANVVILPERALRGSGSQRQVEIMDGMGRRLTSVTVGLITGGDAEIISGLAEGTDVYLPVQ
jgi:multidrug resistance efflux pump